MRQHTKLACVIAAIFATSIHQAGAQSAPATAPADSSTATGTSTTASKKTEQLDTVVVTAQKRKEDANKVPLSISVMSGEQIEAAHITDIADVTRAVPNISFSGQGAAGPGLSNIEIRGISSAAGSSTVGVYMDDVSMTTRNLYSLGSAEPKFFDISRIEVLRGPQGTLYGASSLGGTIKFITNQPDASGREVNFHTEVSTTEHGGTNTLANAVINQPLIPGELALRLGVQTGRTSGYIDQVSPSTGGVIASGINSEQDRVVRAALKWSPTRNLSITPSIFYQEVSTDDIDASYLSLPPNQTNKIVREPGVDRLKLPSVTVNYDFGNADLISVTSYYERTFNRTQDGTTVNSQYIGGTINTTPGAPAGLGDAVSVLPSAVYLNNDARQISQEVRLTSKPYDPKGNTPYTWLAGAYFSNLHTTVFDNEPVFGINSTFAQYGTTTLAILGSTFPNDNSYYSVRHYETKQYASFGEFNYYLNPDLHATFGLRYLHAKDTLARDGDFYFAGGPVHTIASSKADAVTPKFALSWDVDSTDLLYGTISKGVRLGSENRDIPYSICSTDFQNLNLSGSPASFGPDKLWSYEAGNKSRFWNNHLSVNLAAFYISWDQIQQDIVLPTCGYDFETNIGKAKSYGAEFEVKAKPIPDLILGFSGGYTHAELASDVASLGVKSGDPIEGVPEYNAALNAEYHFLLPADTDGFVRGASHWIGKSHGTLVKTDPDYDRPSYFTFDASAGANYNNWELSLFVKNLFNNDKVIQRPNVQFVEEGYRVRPRTIGISFSGKL